MAFFPKHKNIPDSPFMRRRTRKDPPRLTKSELRQIIDAALKEDDKKEEKRVNRALRWSIPIAAVVFAAVQGASQFLGEKFAEKNHLDTMLLSSEFNMIVSQNAMSGRCIYAGQGLSSYAEISNQISQKLHDSQYFGYGFCEPMAGSQKNIEALQGDSGMTGLALAQHDAVQYLREEGKILYATVLVALNNVPECALMPASQNVPDLKTAIKIADQSAVDKAQGKEGRDLRLEIPAQGSGSYITATHIIKELFNEKGVSVTYSYNAQEAAQSVKGGRADMAIAVEYPLRIGGKYMGLMAEVQKGGVHLVGMPTDLFSRHFKNGAVPDNTI